MNLYVMVVLFINAATGEPAQEIVSSAPMTLETCIETLSDRGPVPVKDGLAQFAFCKKVEGKVST